jgi:tRNA-dihydrouridine synthase
LKDGTLPRKISVEEKLKVLKIHLSYISKYRTMPAESKLGYMRKISQYYIKDWHNACNIRRIMNNVKTYEQLAALLERIPEITEKDAACL